MCGRFGHPARAGHGGARAPGDGSRRFQRFTRHCAERVRAPARCRSIFAGGRSSALSFRILRIAALVLVCAGCVAAPAIAQADDLIQLNGDRPVTLQGNYNFGLLYLDGVVRLAADTSITATDVFIGPDAQLQTCWDIGTAGKNCDAGRSLSITARAASRSRPRSTCAG